jgi:type IV pilus assembly protein PilW
MMGKSRQQGFTLVELLVVMVIMGVVVMAIYGLYQSNQRSNLKQDEVVELQQNLRVAMEQLRKDILLAGFMCPIGSGIQSAPNQSVDLDSDGDFTEVGESNSAFIVNTASTMGVGVRMDITTPFDSPDDPTTPETIRVASAEMAKLLKAGNYVRIIRPGDFGQPVDQVLKVTGISVSDPANPTVTVTGFNAVGTYRTGYMIVRVLDLNTDTDGDPNTNPPVNPSTIQYYLEKNTGSNDPNQRILVRYPSDGDRDRVATNITDLRFQYLLDDSTETSTVPATKLSDIRAIRVTLTGTTDATHSAGTNGVTTRTLSSVINLRNR